MLRKYNEANDALAKMVSEWATVPSVVFASDLHRPSVDYKEDEGTSHSPADPASGTEAPMAPEPEAIDIE